MSAGGDAYRLIFAAMVDAAGGVRLPGGRAEACEALMLLTPAEGEITLLARFWRDSDGKAHAEDCTRPAP